MSSLDALYYALAVGFLIFVGFISFALYRLGIALETLNRVLREVEDIARDIGSVKNFLKVGLLGIINRLLGGPRRGGGEG
jgi:hypothetical protein